MSFFNVLNFLLIYGMMLTSLLALGKYSVLIFFMLLAVNYSS